MKWKIVAAVGIITCIATAAPASADNETGFLAELNGYGFVIQDTVKVLITGYQTCTNMYDYPAEQVAQELFDHAAPGVMPTMDKARHFVLAASHQLCPELGIYQK